MIRISGPIRISVITFMNLHTLPPTTTGSKKRIGRGYGSGKGGHTSSRGQKGQLARTKVKLLNQGTKSNKDFYRKTPMLRGKSRLQSHQPEIVVVKLSQLAVYETGETVNLETLMAKKLITEKQAKSQGVKILFDKAIDKALHLEVPASATVLKHVQTEARPAPKKETPVEKEVVKETAKVAPKVAEKKEAKAKTAPKKVVPAQATKPAPKKVAKAAAKPASKTTKTAKKASK